MLRKIYLITTVIDFVIMFVYLFFLSNTVPTSIALDFTVTSIGSKWTVPLIFTIAPLISALIFFFTTKDYNPQTKHEKVLKYVNLFTQCAIIYLSWFVIYLADTDLMVGQALPFPVSLTVGIVVGVTLMSLAPVVRRCQFDDKIGFKTRWTIGCQESWDITHKYGMYCVLIAGVVCMLGGVVDFLFKTNYIALIVGLVITLMLLITPYIMSFVIYKEVKNKQNKEMKQ